MAEIVYQNKDVASKVVGEALLGRTLKVFGFPHLKVVSLLPTNLPVIESNELRLDNLFLLNDGSVAIIDYESDFSKENFIKYLNYIARVIKRYAKQKTLDTLSQIRVIVIYTADVSHADSVYNLGSLILITEPVYLIQMDAKRIFGQLAKKIHEGQPLSEDEALQMMFLPLTVKGKREKQVLTIQTVQLAKKIADRGESIRILAGILTFTDKVIDEAYRRRIKEDMKMTQIERMIRDEAREEFREELLEEVTKEVTQNITEKLTKSVREEVTKSVTEEVTKSVTEEVTKSVTEKVTKTLTSQFREEGIQLLVLDNLEEKAPKGKILQKLQRHFHLTEEKAEQYYEKFGGCLEGSAV